MKILHVFPDHKFLLFTAEIFDACDNISNLYLLRESAASANLEEIGRRENVRLHDAGYTSSSAMKNDLAWCDCLIIHFLDDIGMKMILEAPSHIVVIWSGWGGDYYALFPEQAQNLLGHYTQDIVAGINKRNSSPPPGFMRDPGRKLSEFRAKFLKRKQIRKAVSRVDLFSAPLQEEYALVRSAFGPDFRAHYVQLNYGSVERTFLRGPDRITGNNILVGNSATATNNHAEVFAALSLLDMGDREIIVPLSYGDDDYRKSVIHYGRELFDTRFKPAADFVPLETYNRMIADCATVVMGHRRQQALWNICSMLYKGGKLFMHEDSVIYQVFKNKGYAMYGLSDLVKGNKHLFEPLTDKQIQTNRAALVAQWGHDVVLKNVRHLVSAARELMASRA